MIRLHPSARSPQWELEFSARVVDDQGQVATSLFESATPGLATFDVPACLEGRSIDMLAN